ncbi:8105_t:CDS:2 [Cetraspora pellucida]|uniref:8105_t:CDS:1 n=1 Tax=Cetraspora pellucida TaxID=1433469 RepID=A0A9N9H4T9_9GLOM|nr:8105_t:CDS:2 [Cetraspora pellucida]
MFNKKMNLHKLVILNSNNAHLDRENRIVFVRNYCSGPLFEV